MNMDFVEIVNAAKEGDNRAFEALYNMTKDSAYFIALSITKNEQDAMDILQDSYIKAFEKIGTLKQPELFEHWLNRIVSNTSKNFLAKKKPMLFADVIETIPNEWNEELNKDYIPHESVDSKETSRLIMDIINKLSEDKRLVILMYYYQNMQVTEIAETLELPVTTVKYKLLSARAEIKKGIEELEKKGTKLYSIAILAVLPGVLTMYASNYSAPAFTASLTSGVSGTMAGGGSSSGSSSSGGSSSSAGENASATGNGTSGPSSGGKPVSAGKGAPIKGKFLSTMAGKITVAVVAVAVIGGAAAAVAISGQNGGLPVVSSQNTESQDMNSENKENSNSEHDTGENNKENSEITEDTQKKEETQNEAPATDYEYRAINDGQNMEIIKYIGNEKEVVIPSKIEGKPVTGICESAFEGCTGITSVTIPDSVKEMLNYVFRDCSSLSEIKMPEEGISLGVDVFKGTKWYESQPDGMVYLGRIAYKYKGQMPENTTIAIEDGTKTIAGGAFYGCKNLVGVTIPDSVTTMCINAFKNCTSLKSIEIPEGITEIPIGAFYCCKSLETVTLPNSLTVIRGSAFRECEAIKNITIPDGVTSIIGLAFQGCVSLESIVLPDSITEIGTAFENCTSLVTVKLPENENFTRIAGLIFKGCSSLKNIVIPNTVTTIGDHAFMYCTSLESITIPDSVTMLNAEAFAGCSMLETVNIQGHIKTIYWGTFYQCTSLKSVTIPDSVKKIDNVAFQGCTSLEKLTIPATVTSFGTEVFKECSSSLTIYGTSGSAAEEYAAQEDITFVAE